MVTKTLTKVRRTRHEHSEKFTKDIGNIRKYQTEITVLKNTITALQKFNRRVQAEERTSNSKTG